MTRHNSERFQANVLYDANLLSGSAEKHLITRLANFYLQMVWMMGRRAGNAHIWSATNREYCAEWLQPNGPRQCQRG